MTSPSDEGTAGIADDGVPRVPGQVRVLAYYPNLLVAAVAYLGTLWLAARLQQSEVPRAVA